MISEGFARASLFVREISHEMCMVKVRCEVGPISVSERAVGVCDLVGNRSANGYLYALDGIHDQQTQLAIEDVQPGDVIERRVRAESLAALERQAICAKAAVAYVLQPVQGSARVAHGQTALAQQI